MRGPKWKTLMDGGYVEVWRRSRPKLLPTMTLGMARKILSSAKGGARQSRINPALTKQLALDIFAQYLLVKSEGDDSYKIDPIIAKNIAREFGPDYLLKNEVM